MIIEFSFEVGATVVTGTTVGIEGELKERLAGRELKEKLEHICFQPSKFFAILHFPKIELLILSTELIKSLMPPEQNLEKQSDIPEILFPK
jgi:CBS domain containing-hemolysin-like protein